MKDVRCERHLHYQTRAGENRVRCRRCAKALGVVGVVHVFDRLTGDLLRDEIEQ